MTVQNPDEPALLAEIEADLAEYPQDEVEILLNGAHRLKRAGHVDHAIELYHRLTSRRGEGRAYGRQALASLLFDVQQEDEAREQLSLMASERDASASPYELVGELFEDRGELAEASLVRSGR